MPAPRPFSRRHREAGRTEETIRLHEEGFLPVAKAPIAIDDDRIEVADDLLRQGDSTLASARTALLSEHPAIPVPRRLTR